MPSSLVSLSLQFLDYSVSKILLLVLFVIRVDSLLLLHPYFNDCTGFQFHNESIIRLLSLLLKPCILENRLICLIFSFHIAQAEPFDHHHQTSSSFPTSAHPLAAVLLHIMLHHYGILCPTVFAILLFSLPSAKNLKHISFLHNIYCVLG